jgi:microcystin degradation protein MlrC
LREELTSIGLNLDFLFSRRQNKRLETIWRVHLERMTSEVEAVSNLFSQVPRFLRTEEPGPKEEQTGMMVDEFKQMRTKKGNCSL